MYAGPLAGHSAEPPCGSQIARAAFPRAILHALARQGRHRKQCQAFAVPRRQERIQLLQGLVGKRVLQPGDFGQHQPDGGDRQHEVRLRPVPLPGGHLCPATDCPGKQPDGQKPCNHMQAPERHTQRQQPARLHHGSVHHHGEQGFADH